MLEFFLILALFGFELIIAIRAERKKLGKFPYQIMLVLFSVTGWFLGKGLGAPFFAKDDSSEGGDVMAALGAVAGAAVALFIMRFLSEQETYSAQTDNETKPEVPPIRKYGGWILIPVILALLACACLLALSVGIPKLR